MLHKSEVVLKLYRHSVDEIVTLIGVPMFILAILILAVVAILHLLLHFVVRKDNMLVVFGSVVFAAISMAASYFFVMSQWDLPGHVYITVLLGTYITAELLYISFTVSMMEMDISKSVDVKLEKMEHKGDMKYAFWYALSGRQDKIAEAIGRTEPFGANEYFAVACWPFINSQSKPDVYWGETLRIGLIPCNEVHFNGLRWQPVENDTAIVVNDKVVRLHSRNTR